MSICTLIVYILISFVAPSVMINNSSTHSQRERATFKSSSDSIKSLKNKLKWCILITKNFKFELENWFIIIKYLNFISIILNLFDLWRRDDNHYEVEYVQDFNETKKLKDTSNINEK